MHIKEHTRYLIASLVMLSAFATAGVSAYKILQYPTDGYSTGEGYGDIFGSKNKASAAESITVLSLADKSLATTTTVTAPKKEGVSLCATFPEKISGYSLRSTKITNFPSEMGHGSFFSAQTRKLSTVNPEERIRLEYVQSATSTADTSTGATKASSQVKNKVASETLVQIFRYGVFGDMQKDFASIFDLSPAHTESRALVPVKNTVAKNTKDILPQYLYKNEGTLILVSGKKEADIRRIAEQIGGACEGKPVFKSDIPKGFVAWRTTDVDLANRIEYVKIADADITLNLDITKFGTEILITDQTFSDNLGLGDLFDSKKYRVFSIPTIDSQGKQRPMQQVHLFVVKSTNLQILMNALKNRQTTILGGTHIQTERTSYQGLHVGAGKNVFTYEQKTENGETNQYKEYIYVVTRKGTSFVFVYDFDDIATVETIVDNIK